MNRTKIEWTDYTWNPITGCKRNCPYCYVKRIKGYDRMPTFHPQRLDQPYHKKISSKIFVCSTADLFGEWVPDKWIQEVLTVIKRAHWHTFQFLTKSPLRYTDYDFPDNCWIGITHTGYTPEGYYYDGLMDSKVIIAFEGKKNTFLSCEPLLGGSISIPSNCRWVIIGAMTGEFRDKYNLNNKWISDIVKQTDKLRIPVFMKNNLRPYWEGEWRQEFPNEE